MSVQVTLNFSDIDEAIAFLARDKKSSPTSEKAIVSKSEQKRLEAQKPADTASAATQSSAAAADVAATSDIDYEKDVKPKFVDLMKKKGREVCVGIVKAFGCKSTIAEVPKDRYQELLDTIAKASAS